MRMRPHVLHLIESLEHGGAERVVVDLANQQRQEGFEVTVCCLKRRGELFAKLDDGVQAFCLHKREGSDVAAIWRLVRLIRRRGVELVHTHAWGVYLDGGIAARVGGAQALLHTAHGPYPSPGAGRLGRFKAAARRFLEHRLAARTHRLVAVSESIACTLREQLRFPPDKVTTVHNGIAALDPPRAKRSEPASDRVRIVTVGRLAPIKNQAMMIEALARLAPRCPNLELVLVGDGPERAALGDLATQLRIADRVELPGFEDDVAAVLASADIFLLTSRHEGISIALLEAMRAELPVIATRVGGVPETVVDGLSGVLIEPGDVGALSGAIELLALSEGKRQRLGQNAGRRIRERFSSTAMSLGYANLYREALAGASQRSATADAERVAGRERPQLVTMPGGPVAAVAGARPLRILYHHRTQGRGAEGVHIASIVRELEALGHAVTLVSPAGIDPLATAGFAPVDKAEVSARGVVAFWKAVSRRLPGWLFELSEIAYNVLTWWRLRRVLGQQQFDLFYERYAFYLVAGAWMARRCGIPFVLEANEVSGIPERARAQSFPRLCGAFERFLFRRCTAVLTVSSYLRRLALRQGIAPERVRVVPNAIDAGSLRPVARCPDLVARYGLVGRTVMGFAGWFDHWDRLDLLIRALARLRPEHPESAVLLIGDGPSLGPARERVRELGLDGDVVMCGAVEHEQIHDHLALLDIAVLPHSNRFGSPVVMFEFMARRVPIVAPRLEPIEDVLQDGVSALLFEPLDEDGLVQALDRYLRSSRLRAHVAEAAYRVLITEHTWRRNAQRAIEAAGLMGAEVGVEEDLRRVG